MKVSTEQFILKAKIIHDNKYGYDDVEYLTAKSKVFITCFVHGKFLQKPNNHLSGHGCPKCAIELRKKNLSTSEFIKLAKDVHGDTFDYSNTKYYSYKEPVSIICKIHGEFLQTPNNHLSKHGCIKCGIDTVKNLTSGKYLFVDRANKQHHNKYDYRKILYFNKDILVTIICPKHGEFQQSPHNHIRGHGCPTCKESKGEQKIREYLFENNIQFEPQYKFQDCRNKRCLPFDFLIWNTNATNKKIKLIEFQGQQHDEPVGFGGCGILKFERTLLNDSIKKDFCLKKEMT